MLLNAQVKRELAMLLIAVLAFAQASVALADCPMQRGALAQMFGQAAQPACEQGTHVMNEGPRYANRCLAHCTSDLQLGGLPVALVQDVAQSPVLRVSETERPIAGAIGLEAPPPGAPPPRILFQSFLI